MAKQDKNQYGDENRYPKSINQAMQMTGRPNTMSPKRNMIQKGKIV